MTHFYDFLKCQMLDQTARFKNENKKKSLV